VGPAGPMTRRHVAKLALIALCALSTLAGAGVASADPFNPPCVIEPGQDCSHNGTPRGAVVYCPETGGWISQFSGSCPSLWVGPYLPGNPSNGGTDDR
jgi:hypothetical protein